MNRTLVVLNTFYPYTRQEDFLANEAEYIQGFDEVIFFPNSIVGNHKTIIYKRKEGHKYVVNKAPYQKQYLRGLFKLLTSSLFYEELFHLVRNNKFTIGRLRILVGFLLYTFNSLKTIEDYITKNHSNDELVLYSYWMHIPAVIACLLKKALPNVKKVVTRCHRFDLYEYASFQKYIPLRKYIFENIDEIHSISFDGIEYLKNNYDIAPNKLILSRLGTIDHGCPHNLKGNTLRIVSCSWMRRVKRIDLILDAIKDSSFNIQWTHFGSGETYDEIYNRAINVSNNKVEIKLMGSVDNATVINSYLNNGYDVFINVSENEGIPVSIMEAMSCGIIPIATDVGGTRELIDNGQSGFLLEKSFEIENLKDILYKIHCMPAEDRHKMSVNSRKKWEDCFSASTNYNKFYESL